MIRDFIKSVALLLLVPMLLSACASTEQTVLITEHFEVTHIWRRSHLYHLGADGAREYLGSAETSNPLGFSGLSRSIGALSPDGNRVVYIHESILADGKSEKESGIYLYEHGSGEQLLHPKADYSTSWARWPKAPPEHTIQVDLDCRNCEPPKLNLPVFISTDGKEYPVALHLASPLHTSAYYGNDVRSLLADGARIDEVNYWGDTALDIAIIRGNEDVALQLIEDGASVWEATSPAMDQSQVVDPEHHAQPIHLAAGLWSITILDAILSKGVNVDLPDNHGHTPLLFAASKSFSGISSLVWGHHHVGEAGDFIEWFYSNSATLIEVIDYLVDQGADINAKDNQGTTLFRRMVNRGSGHSGGQWQVIAENLIEKGADINTQNNSGVTPLHETVGRRKSGSDYKQEWFDKRLEPGTPLRFLLDSGARLDIKDDDGLLPLDWALRDGKYRTARLLIKKMEDAGIEIENVDELRALIDKKIESWDNPRKGILSIFN